MLLTLSGRSFIKIQYSSFPLFPMAFPFRLAICGTSVRSKNILTHTSQYLNGKHEITNSHYLDYLPIAKIVDSMKLTAFVYHNKTFENMFLMGEGRNHDWLVGCIGF